MTSVQGKAIRRKADILRDRYGGLLTLAQLCRELGYKEPRSAKRWAEEAGLEMVQVGKAKKYDADQLAAVLVQRCGMA